MSTLSNAYISAIRSRLNQFIKENPAFSNRTVGRNIGTSSGTISLFRNDKYDVSEESLSALAGRIESFLANEENAATEAISQGHLKFAMTTAAQDIFKTANYAKTEHKIGVVAGVPGCGKTIALKEYKLRNPNTLMIEVTPLITQRSLIYDLCAQLKIPTSSYYKDKQVYVPNNHLFKEICEKLNNTSRLVAFDEGENLTVHCLEIIRRIQDFTNTGILLCGTEKLLDRLRGPRRELAQLFSRVGIWKEIKLLQIGDVKAILKINYPEAENFVKIFLQLSKNNGRLLEHLITLVKKTIQETGEILSEDLIDDAACSLLT